jgi:hypothetical protein
MFNHQDTDPNSNLAVAHARAGTSHPGPHLAVEVVGLDSAGPDQDRIRVKINRMRRTLPVVGGDCALHTSRGGFVVIWPTPSSQKGTERPLSIFHAKCGSVLRLRAGTFGDRSRSPRPGGAVVDRRPVDGPGSWASRGGIGRTADGIHPIQNVGHGRGRLGIGLVGMGENDQDAAVIDRFVLRRVNIPRRGDDANAIETPEPAIGSCLGPRSTGLFRRAE